MSTISDVGTVVLLLMFMALMGSTFLELIFVYNVSTLCSRHFFAFIFATSTTMFLVVLIDMSNGLLSQESTSTTLFVLLAVTLTLTTFVGPWLTIFSFCGDCGVRQLFLRLTISGILLACLFLGSQYTLPSLQEIEVLHTNRRFEGGKVSNATLTEVTIGKVSFFGVIAMGILSGFAAIATPYSFLSPFLRRHGVGDARILLSALMKRQHYLLHLWGTKERIIAQHVKEHEISGKGAQGKMKKSTFLGWIRESIAGPSSPTIEQLKTECDGIQKVSLSIFLQMSDAEAAVVIGENGNTWRGTICLAFGITLLGHAVIRMISTALNLFEHSGEAVDPVSRIFNAMSAGEETNIKRYARPFTVFFNALLIIMSIRGFLLAIFRMTSKFSSSLSPNTTVLLFSTSFGAYMVAQLLMMRLNLPTESRSVVTDVLGKLPFSYYGMLNNACFAISATVSFVLRRFVLYQSTTVD